MYLGTECILKQLKYFTATVIVTVTVTVTARGLFKIYQSEPIIPNTPRAHRGLCYDASVWQSK